MSKFYGFALVAAFLAFAQSSLMAQTSDPKPGLVLVEAESFADKGGWGVDTLSNDVLGSSYLIAHGWGTPVADAKTTVKFPGPGKYQVYVRTHNWVEPWTKEHAPGRFQLAIDGNVMATEFGTKSGGWAWQEGDFITVAPDKLEVELTLHDLSGFDGRVDAIFFRPEDSQAAPPNDRDQLDAFRRAMLKIPSEPQLAGDGKVYDLVVVGAESRAYAPPSPQRGSARPSR